MRNSILLLVLLIIHLSCGGGNVLPPEQQAAQGESAKKITNDAWLLYETGKYNEALEKFRLATQRDKNYWDAYNGPGWTNFALHILSYSVSHFGTALAESDSTEPDVFIGLSLALFEDNRYQESINSTAVAIAIDTLEIEFAYNGSYRFVHNEKVNAKSVRKIMALSYYYLGNFEEAYNQIKNYLKPQATLNKESSDFARLLLIELEGL